MNYAKASVTDSYYEKWVDAMHSSVIARQNLNGLRQATSSNWELCKQTDVWQRSMGIALILWRGWANKKYNIGIRVRCAVFKT